MPHMPAVHSWTVHRGSPADTGAVETLMHAELGRGPAAHRIRQFLADFPSALAWGRTRENPHVLLGFAYCLSFAPDVLELGNLVVAPAARGRGVGTELVTEIERQAAGTFAAVILSNSSLWTLARGEKRPAESYYERMGYSTILSTGPSVVMAKHLPE